ncbi:MAG: OmpA family protein [Myxococcota bacterium]|nr:OmpA family protein [Myxococcota bacterium]
MRTTTTLTLLLLSASTPGSTSVAHADRRFELGVALGGHTFSSSVELGVADEMLEPGPESGAMLGARFAVPFARRLAVEAEAMMIPTKDDVLGEVATVYGLRTHARFDLLTGRLRPFVVLGAGAHVIRSTSAQLDDDVDRAYHWGGGVRFAISDQLDARLDARHLLVPDRSLDGATSDYEVTAGVMYRFGKRTRPALVVVPEPPPGDRDGDKVPDDVDQCITQPEDFDGFEDADGCPDLDNDRDGIVDASDRCPLEAEARNGWQDEDGCPDAVIAELAGIGFEYDSAKLDSASADLLERAYQILKDNPAIAIEVSGHTSAEGNADRNLELSLRRAEAVEAYLIKRGIADARILTVGHGSDVPLADNATADGRRKNRRIEFRIVLPSELP